MISSEHLSKRIDQYINKAGTNDNFKISLPDKVRAINSAQLILVKRKMGLNNVYKMGFESFRKRYDDLDFLIKSNVPVDIKQHDVQGYYVDTKPLSDYMFYIKSWCSATRDNCTDRRIRNYLVKRTDLENFLKDYNYRPSFDWQEQLVTFASDQIEIFHDPTCKLNKLYLDYIRLPKEIDIRGYRKGGVDSQTIDCEFPVHLEDELLDIIVEQLAMSILDQGQVQFSQSRQQRNE